MSMQIIIEKRNAEPPAPVNDGPYGELLEDMRLAALDLVELLARERARTFDGMGGSFWINSNRVLDRTKQLLHLAEQRAASLKDGSFRR